MRLFSSREKCTLYFFKGIVVVTDTEKVQSLKMKNAWIELFEGLFMMQKCKDLHQKQKIISIVHL